jgi:DNA-binding NarL/FixJ family response regulator
MPRSVLPVTVFLADPSDLVRGRVAAMLGAAGLVIVGQARTLSSAIEGILTSRPDVVVMDVHLEGGNGLQVLRTIRPVAADIGFVVFSNQAGPPYRKRYVAEGAFRFLDKTSEFDQLVRAVAAASQRSIESCSR